MESDKDYIKKTFASKFKNFEPDLPDSVWTRVEEDLKKPTLTPLVKQKNSAIRRVIIIGASVAAVLLIGIFTLNELVRPHDIASKVLVEEINVKAQEIEKNTDQTESIKENLIQPSSNSMLANTPLRASAAIQQSANTLELKNNSEEIQDYNQIIEVAEMTELIALNNVDQSIEDTEPIIENSFNDFEQKLEEQIAAFEREGEILKQVLADNTTSSSPKQKEGFGFGVEAGSGFNKGDDAKNQFNTMYNGLSDHGAVFLRTQRIKLEHNQPITFGLNISKRISNKLSIESGITYTYLSSRMKADDQSDIQQKDRQYFNYFGIPLSLNYTFAEWKRLKFYTSLGAMIQKDFYGRISSSMYVDGLIGTEKDHKEKISQKNPQFSSMATLGVSYSIYKDISVYGNFGGAYYFDAKNEYETIYSDKKWLFNLNLGLKFEF